MLVAMLNQNILGKKWNESDNKNKERNQKMNKIYNNLSIENLIKTEWFNQFTYSEQEEIRKGLEANIDVSIYANPKYYWKQMKEIRLGLEEDLNVSIYAKIEFYYQQMEEIRLGLRNNLDVSYYAKTEYPWFKMREIRLKMLKESTL